MGMSTARHEVTEPEDHSFVEAVDGLSSRVADFRSYAASRIDTPDLSAMRFDTGDHEFGGMSENTVTLIFAARSEGRLMACYDGEAVGMDVRAGLFFFIPDGVRQEYAFRGRTTNDLFSIKRSVLDTLRDENPELAGASTDEPWIGWTRPRLAGLIEEYNRLVVSREMGWRSLSDACKLRIAVELLSARAQQDITSGVQALSADEVARITDYVVANLDADVPLDDAARLLGRDPFGFGRAFKAATGTTYPQMVLAERVALAQRLLRDTREGLAEIAYACGFSSQSHLTTTMRRRVGVTPGRYRTMASA